MDHAPTTDVGRAALGPDTTIRMAPSRTDTIADLQEMLQRAVQLEMATLPPYLYALYTAGANPPASDRLRHIVHEEMVHMVLACNILNAIGGTPQVADTDVVPTYPAPLPFSIDQRLPIHLLPFGEAAMQQGMGIERPEEPLVFGLAAAERDFQTIGELYDSLRGPLRALPASAWNARPDRQVDDTTWFPGEIFPVRTAADAVRAIDRIVSEGEGAPTTPLDFGGELAHYYRFEEMARDQVLQRAPDQPHGYAWGPPLGIDWSAAVAAHPDPATLDLRDFPDAAAAQDRCDRAFTVMLQEIQRSVTGRQDRLGHAVAAMLTLRREAMTALTIPCGTPALPAGPAFRYRPDLVRRRTEEP